MPGVHVVDFLVEGLGLTLLRWSIEIASAAALIKSGTIRSVFDLELGGGMATNFLGRRSFGGEDSAYGCGEDPFPLPSGDRRRAFQEGYFEATRAQGSIISSKV